MSGVSKRIKRNVQYRPCEYCNVNFKPRSTYLRTGKGGRFCSMDCFNKFAHDRMMNHEIQNKKFWDLVDIKSEDECWVFKGIIHLQGYGMICLFGQKKSTKAHRWAYILSKGEVPIGLAVLHSCDNRPCCNPKHLSAGTQKENMRQMIERNRGVCPRGDKHPGSKITEEIARSILKEYNGTQTYAYFAGKYNISHSLSSRLIKGETWKHIER